MYIILVSTGGLMWTRENIEELQNLLSELSLFQLCLSSLSFSLLSLGFLLDIRKNAFIRQEMKAFIC